ncbi:MAG: nucleoside triphosphate pyrophosphohydrolase [Lentisphaeria bacterium]|nr:nucleoside triphosphate pyrophosphohydrolase [Lentisphaeria bacterium]
METYSADADSLMRVLRRLRAPDGCPWDRKQTRESLVRHFESECGELIDAIEHNDAPHICEELGDVLMNVLFQVVIAEENGEFTLTDVWREIVDKMIRRHAHVFGDKHAENPEEVLQLWQQIKAEERAASGNAEPKSAMDDVKHSLSALTRAEKLQKKAAEFNFDWHDPVDIIAKIKEETREVEDALASGDDSAVDDELGDLLFAVVNLIRFRKRAGSEELLRQANRKFESRFRRMEAYAVAEGVDFNTLSADELNAVWDKIKHRN